MAVLAHIIRVGIALMINRWIVALSAAFLLSGCVGKARHPQCQDLKGEAFGERLGAAISGRYIDDIKANIADGRYERCEEMFDLAQYQSQLQSEQHQAQVDLQEQERQQAMRDKVNGPEMQEKLGAASLKDLVNCEKAVQDKSDTHPQDVKAIVSYACEREIDNRVNSGKVDRSVVNKMLSQS